MEQWFVRGAVTGLIGGAVLVAVPILVSKGVAWVRDPRERGAIRADWLYLVVAVLVAAVGTAIAAGCGASVAHAATTPLHDGISRRLAATLIGKFVGAVVEGALGYGTMYLLVLTVFNYDGNAILGVWMAAICGVLLGAAMGGVAGYQAGAG